MKTRIIAIAIFISGCATTKGYEQKLETYKGKKADFVIMDWGAPNSTYPLDEGGKVMTFYRQEGASGYIASGYVETSTKSCRTNFVVDESSVVQGWSFEGNTCKAKPHYPLKCHLVIWPISEWIWKECET